jgi:hypothetical protein
MSYLKHLPEWRRTTMMHVVASSDPRIFTFSVKKKWHLILLNLKIIEEANNTVNLRT